MLGVEGRTSIIKIVNLRTTFATVLFYNHFTYALFHFTIVCIQSVTFPDVEIGLHCPHAYTNAPHMLTGC